MSQPMRWVKFNFVGAVGVLVQLAALRLLISRGLSVSLATGLAVETAVLHNFAWHRLYTWRDRGRAETFWPQLLRFHISNGFVSIVGNVIITRFASQYLRWPVMAANILAIGICSLLNYFSGDRFVFRDQNAADV